ncbi:MAG TPA: hypothetical protein VKM72_14550 [Thermoanaerobaculia bacterium]|nr:hypothetical protein [Thermoanaerobaculia bacterium]
MADDLQPTDEPKIRGGDTAAADHEDELFTATEAAKLLGIPNARLSRYIEDLRLDIPRGKSLRINREDLAVLRTYHRNRADGPRFRETQEAREFAEALKDYGRIFRSLRQLTTEALKVEKRLRKAVPAGLAVIHTLPEPDLVLTAPLRVNIAPSGKRYRASFPEADLEAMGATRDEALLELRQEIARAYQRLERGRYFYNEDPERLSVLRDLITRRPLKKEI